MRLFGLIGFPLSHSFSSEYFARKFSDNHITDAAYKLFPIDQIGYLAELLAQNPELVGLNVTIPHKVNVIPFLDELSTEAAVIGAVNCVKITRAGSKVHLKGYNTDVTGFAESLKPLLKTWHTKALVLGSGGASKAVCHGLKLLGISFDVVSRNAETGRLTYTNLDEALLASHQLIVNTTPMGMYPAVDSFPPIPYEFLGEKHLLFDLVYNPVETIFMKKGLEYGATVKNGYEMLVLQAERSWEIWN